MRVDLPLDKKTVENQDWVTGPPGRPAAGPPGRRAAGPSRAVGRGLLGRGPAFRKTSKIQDCYDRIDRELHSLKCLDLKFRL